MYTGLRMKEPPGLRAGRKAEHVDSQSGMAREILYLMPGIFDNLGVLLTAWNRSSCQVRK
jgi:hypothetical protein